MRSLLRDCENQRIFCSSNSPHLQVGGHGGLGAAHEAAEGRGAQGAGGLQTGQGAWGWKDLQLLLIDTSIAHLCNEG